MIIRSRSVISAASFAAAYIAYSIVSVGLALHIADGWEGFGLLVFGPVYYGLVGVGSVMARLISRRRGAIAYSRWLLYPLLALQALALALDVLTPPLGSPLSLTVWRLYLLLLPAFMLFVTLGSPPAESAPPARGRAAFIVDGLAIVGLVGAVALAQVVEPAVREASGLAECEEARASTTHVPPDVCRAPEIFVVAPDGSGVTRLTNLGFVATPAWSSDGRHLAFAAGHSLARIDADGQNQTVLATAAGPITNPNWSPDGRSILFEHPDSADGNDPTAPSAISIVPSDGLTPPRRLAHGSFASWSPDGRQVLFRSPESNYGTICIQEIDAAQARCTRGPGGLILHPRWSPDGRQIVFSADTAGPEIYTLDVDSTQIVQLTTRGGRNPHWSPKGDSILFERDDDMASKTALCVLGLGDTTPRCIVSYPLGEGEPAWSPDGAEVTYIAGENEEGRYGLYHVRSDGKAPARLAWNGFLRSPAWSPDGRLIAFAG